MTILRIVYKSLRQHMVSTVVSAIAVSLAGGLIMAVWVMREESNKTFTSITGGFDAVLGARSSKLQLVLNSIFHLEESPGNIDEADLEQIRNHPAVELALPIAVGDNFKGYRLVGTTTELFDKVEYARGKRYEIVGGGRPFDEHKEEAVLGSFAARKLGLKVGDDFHPFHGLNFDESKAHAESFIVSGIFKPTGTPGDRVIWIPLEGHSQMSGHDPSKASELSAALIKLRAGNPMAAFQLDQFYNQRGDRLTFAWPIGAIVARLFDKIGWFDQVLRMVSYLVVLVATACILASISNSMNERRREFAILRALGASRMTVFTSIVAESTAIAAVGMVGAFVVYAMISFVSMGVIRAETGVVIDPFAFHGIMVSAPAGVLALAALAGIFPAIQAYRTDVAIGLLPVS